MHEVQEVTGLRKQWLAFAHNVMRFAFGKKHITANVPWLRAQLHTVARDVHGRHLFKSAVHEPGATRALLRYLEAAPQDVIFDVGANLGYYSLVFDRATGGDVAIHAFEAEPTNFAILERNLADNGARSVTPHRCAVSDREGEASLFLYKQSNLGKHSLVPLEGSVSVSVPTTTLDAFWRDQGFGNRTPTLLKIDIEGAEHSALAGAQQVLRRCPFVLSEFTPKFMRRAGVDPRDHVAEMLALGLLPHAIGRDGSLTAADTDALPRAEANANLVWLRSSARDSDWWQRVVSRDTRR